MKQPMKKELYNPIDIMPKLQSLHDKHANLILNPEKAALLVLDMQQFFLSPSSHAHIPTMQAIVPNIKALQDAFLANNLPVIQTQHVNTKANAHAMLRWWGDHILTADDPNAAIIPELINPKSPIITKTQYDAFWQTNLAQMLEGVEQVIITGVMTHICCESTARAAFVHGFDVFTVVDAMASYNQDFHFGSLLNLAHAVAKPMLTQEIKLSLYRRKDLV